MPRHVERLDGAIVELVPDVDPEELAPLLELRNAALTEEGTFLFAKQPGRHPAWDRWDPGSIHFALREGAEVVAACRWTPPDASGRFETCDHTPLPPVLAARKGGLLQIGRVVVREDSRRRRMTELLLGLACRWLRRHTEHLRWFGMCRPRLAELYRHFGAEVLDGEDRVVAARGNRRYRFVRGSLEGSARAIAAFLEAEATAGGSAWRFPSERRPAPALPAPRRDPS